MEYSPSGDKMLEPKKAKENVSECVYVCVSVVCQGPWEKRFWDKDLHAGVSWGVLWGNNICKRVGDAGLH